MLSTWRLLLMVAPAPDTPKDLVSQGRFRDAIQVCAADFGQQVRQIRAALAELSPSDKDVLLLRYQGELRLQEIGKALDISEAAARKRANRALPRLRTLLQGIVS